jgi:hypothetical protein
MPRRVVMQLNAAASDSLGRCGARSEISRVFWQIGRAAGDKASSARAAIAVKGSIRRRV